MTIEPRKVYDPADMRCLLEPKSIAVIGASTNPKSLGYRTLRNLARFQGGVYPVNARYDEIDGRRCWPSLASLPEVPDCVVLAIGKDGVEDAVRDCAARGVGSVVIYASGYAETGREDGIAAQERLLSLARSGNMRLVGPNCAGLSSASGFHAGFAEFLTSAARPQRQIGLVSQSGALGLSLSQAVTQGFDISHVLSCGNSCDVDVADYANWLLEQSGIGAIAMVYEGLRDPRRLQEVGQRAKEMGKTVVVNKLGRSDAGAQAAQFHTGSQAGTFDAFADMARDAGLVTNDRIETLLETAAFFAKAPIGQNGGVAVVSSSGGTGIICVDTAARHGVLTPQPSSETIAILKTQIPDFGAARNPCDATAQAVANPDSFIAATAAMISDERYNAIVLPWGKSMPASLLPPLGEVAARAGKALCVVWTSQGLAEEGFRDLTLRPDISAFRSVDSCFAALAKWNARRQS